MRPRQFGELIGWDRLTSPPEQRRQQRPEPGREPGGRDSTGLTSYRLQRPEHPELHGVSPMRHQSG